MNTKETLQAAYHLLDDKKRWTQGVSARDINGEQVRCRAEEAVCWCAMGALWKTQGKLPVQESPAESALERACRELYGTQATSVNDLLGYRQIRAAFRRAIRNA